MSEFIMGARLNLRDNFSPGISQATKTTNSFKSTVEKAGRSSQVFKSNQDRLANSMGQYEKGARRANAVTRTWIGSNGRLRSSFGWVQRGIQGAIGAFSLWKAKSWLIDANADMETFKNTLAVVLKDEKKAVEALAWAEKFAAKTPFEIPQIVEATTRMTAYGLNAQKTLGIIGDMASVMGKDLMSAVEAVADSQTGELERLKEFGITKKMIEDQAKLMKVTVTNNKGQITDQRAFNAVLFKLMEDRFKGGMEMQSTTFKGMLSNTKDFVSNTGRELGKPLFDKMKQQLSNLLDYFQKLKDDGTITKWIKGIQDTSINTAKVFTDNWGTIKPVIEGVAGALLILKSYQIMYNVAVKAGLVIQALSSAWAYAATVIALMREGTSLAAIAQMELNLAMAANPIGLVVAAVVGLVAVFAWAWNRFPKFREAMTALWEGCVASVKFAYEKFKAIGQGIIDFFTGLGTQLFNSGKAIITTIVDGIKAMANDPVKAIKDIFAKARKLLPFSDAKEGPFSNLTLNGGQIMTTLASGVEREAGTFRKAVTKAFGETPGVTVKANAVSSAARTSAASGSRSVQISNPVIKIAIEGAGANADIIAEKVITKLKALMEEADDILMSEDMGMLLT